MAPVPEFTISIGGTDHPVPSPQSDWELSSTLPFLSLLMTRRRVEAGPGPGMVPERQDCGLPVMKQDAGERIKGCVSHCKSTSPLKRRLITPKATLTGTPCLTELAHPLFSKLFYQRNEMNKNFLKTCFPSHTSTPADAPLSPGRWAGK